MNTNSTTTAPSMADALYRGTAPAEAPATVEMTLADRLYGGSQQKMAATEPQTPSQPKVSQADAQSQSPAPSNAESMALQVPEQSHLSAEDATAVTEFATKHGLTQAHAQAILERDHDMVAQGIESMHAGMEAQSAAWQAEFHADQEYGGAKAKESAAMAAKALVEYGGADRAAISDLLDATGLGNHPALLRMLARVGRSIAEGRPDSRAPAARAQPRSLAESLYGSRAS